MNENQQLCLYFFKFVSIKPIFSAPFEQWGRINVCAGNPQITSFHVVCFDITLPTVLLYSLHILKRLVLHTRRVYANTLVQDTHAFQLKSKHAFTSFLRHVWVYIALIQQGGIQQMWAGYSNISTVDEYYFILYISHLPKKVTSI